MPEWLRKIFEKNKGKEFDKLTDEEKKTIQTEIESEFAQKVKTEEKSKDKSEDKDKDSNMLLDEIRALKSELDAQKVQREKEKSDAKVLKIQTKIQEAIKSGKIPAANEEEKKTWERRLNNDYDDAVSLLDKIQSPLKTETQNKQFDQQKQTLSNQTKDRKALIDAAKEAFTEGN